MTMTDVRRTLTHRSLAEGTRFDPGTYHPTGPATRCWANAWIAAADNGWQLWEGVASKGRGWYVHAWCADDAGILEVTEGWETATRYAGFRINQQAAVLIEGRWDALTRAGMASGVLETLLTAAIEVTDKSTGDCWPGTLALVSA